MTPEMTDADLILKARERAKHIVETPPADGRSAEILLALVAALEESEARRLAAEAEDARLREALMTISAWEPSMAPDEPNGMSIIDVIGIADASLAGKEGKGK